MEWKDGQKMKSSLSMNRGRRRGVVVERTCLNSFVQQEIPNRNVETSMRSIPMHPPDSEMDRGLVSRKGYLMQTFN